MSRWMNKCECVHSILDIYPTVIQRRNEYHLFRDHHRRFKTEPSSALVKYALETGAEEVHGHNVVLALCAHPVDIGDAHYSRLIAGDLPFPAMDFIIRASENNCGLRHFADSYDRGTRDAYQFNCHELAVLGVGG